MRKPVILARFWGGHIHRGAVYGRRPWVCMDMRRVRNTRRVLKRLAGVKKS